MLLLEIDDVTVAGGGNAFGGAANTAGTSSVQIGGVEVWEVEGPSVSAGMATSAILPTHACMSCNCILIELCMCLLCTWKLCFFFQFSSFSSIGMCHSSDLSSILP